MTRPIRIVLADDHPIVLDGLDSLFRLESDLEVVARCMTGEDALHAVRRHQPDILLIDLRMPKMDGLGVLRKLQQEKLPTKVILLAATLEKLEAMEALKLGVRGIVLKELAPRLLLQCVRKVQAGEQWIEKRSHAAVLDALFKREAGARAAAAVLTPREVELVGLVATGMRNKDVASRLGITEGTVKIHLHNIYEKLNIESRVELILYAQSKGLI